MKDLWRRFKVLWQQRIEAPKDADDVRALRIYLISLIAIIGITMSVVYTVLTAANWQFDDALAPWYGPNIISRTVFTFSTCVVSYTRVRRGRLKLATFLIVSIVFFQLTSVSLVDPYNPAVSLWIVMGVVLAVILHGGRAGTAALFSFVCWHGFVIQGFSANPTKSILVDEAIIGIVVWFLTWFSIYRVSQALSHGLMQVSDTNEQLAQERDKLTAILTAITDGVLAVDYNRRVLLFNDAARHLLGLQDAAVLNKHIGQIEMLAPLVSCFDQIDVDKETSDIWTDTLVWQERVLQVSISPVRTMGWAVVMQDITYLKELDEMRADFMATVTHDLKNPINVINASVDIMKMRGDLPEHQLDYLRRIRRASDAMIRLVADLLDIAHLEAGPQLRSDKVNPCDLLAKALDDVRSDAEARQQRLIFDPPSAPAPILGDPSSLNRALVNLLSNAVKYTPDGGEITARLGTADGVVRFEVADNGMGIPPEDQAHIFERFYRVESDEILDIEGTGLGLAIVKAIVEQHNGEVWVESTLGEGSVFGFSIPLATAPPLS